MRWPLLLIFLGGSLFSVGAFKETAPNGFKVGSGPSDEPISITAPNFPGGNVIVDAFPGPPLKGLQPPFPTDCWWQGLTVGNQDAVLAGPFPFQSITRNTGLEFGLSRTREFDGTSLIQRTQIDWNIGFVGLSNTLSNRKVTGWDTQSVCLQYFENIGQTMDTCLVPGAPYMTFTFSNAVILLKSLKGGVTGFNWVTQGKKAKVSTTEGGTYLLYVLDGPEELALTLLPDELTLSSTKEFTGTIRLAKLYDNNQEEVLDAHSQSYPTGVSMSYQVTGDVSTMTWIWDVVGDPSNLLLLCWPHHRKVLQNPNFVDIQYLTIKGYMKGVRGNQWVLKHDLPTITWLPRNSPQPSCLLELEKTLEAEVEDLDVVEPGDFYFWGGSFARDANLATIADHIGRSDLAARVVDIVKQSLGFFFDPIHKPQAAYESLWGGMVNAQDLNYTNSKNGSDIGTKAYYNDHHFLYGYFLHGAAIIGKHDPNWLQEHLDFFNHMSRDIANPSPMDPHYTVTRHMDWFAGHSWASGIANGAGPRDQESSGEAINGYYGLLLWADVTKNTALIAYARLLLAIELAGARDYWHLYPKVNDPDTPYPEQVFKELVTVGNVMDTQAGAWLFWGSERIQVAAIQMLPLVPIGEYTYDVPWLSEVYPYCKAELEDPKIGGAFKSVIYAAYARVDPQTAFLGSRTLIDWGTGNSASNQLYFISTQSSTSDICTLGIDTPEGLYLIQDIASGKYVTTIVDGILSASVDADVLASKFRLKFKPGGSSIYADSSERFVTGLTEEGGPLKAIADGARSNEIFRWAEQPDGSFQLTAMVNSKSVSTEPATGHLVNKGQVSNYKLILTDETVTPVPPPASGKLQNVQNEKYVLSTESDPILRATENNVGDGTTWLFELVPPTNLGNKATPLYAIRSQTTRKVVSGNPEGTSPLSATNENPGGWETFQLIAYQGNYIIIHAVTGLPVSLQPDNTLIDNNSKIDGLALWKIV